MGKYKNSLRPKPQGKGQPVFKEQNLQIQDDQ
jgi:hypothetical protein